MKTREATFLHVRIKINPAGRVVVQGERSQHCDKTDVNSCKSCGPKTIDWVHFRQRDLSGCVLGRSGDLAGFCQVTPGVLAARLAFIYPCVSPD